MKAAVAHFLVRGIALLLLTLPVCQADVPDARQACEYRNSALCEANGITFLQNAPCPAGSKTLRPPGHEDCAKALEAPPKIVRSEPAPSPAKAPHTDLTYIGQIERWLIPLVVIGGGLLLGALALYLLLRKRREEQKTASGSGHPIIVFFTAGAIGLVSAYHAAGMAFTQMDASFNNHDSAGPALIAGGAALLVFALVFQLAFALSALLLHALLGRFQRPD